MPTTTSKIYQETLSKFDQAMNGEDRDEILRQYEILKKCYIPIVHYVNY